ncbi:MAG TPA: sigma factor [Blastocatellia bacterium]|nr:sigma factor [Blastocatellia bacterium]
MATEVKPEPISEDLLLAVYQSLLRYWIKQGVSIEKAEDLAQEGILKCSLASKKWKRKASLKTFLITVAKNAGLDVLRKEARRERIMQGLTETVRLPEEEGL